MKGKTLVILSAVILGMIAIGFGVDMYVQARMREAVALERIRVQEIEKAELSASIAARDKAIEESQAEMARIKEKAAADEAALRAELAALQTATPQQLVDVGSEILGVDDIKSDGQIVQMSLETYRKIVFRLVEHRNYVMVKEPSWLAQEGQYKIQIATLKENEIDFGRREALNESIIVSLRGVVKDTKKAGFWEKAAWAGGGFVAGLFLEKIF